LVDDDDVTGGIGGRFERDWGKGDKVIDKSDIKFVAEPPGQSKLFRGIGFIGVGNGVGVSEGRSTVVWQWLFGLV
jgi:hypothetical protein